MKELIIFAAGVGAGAVSFTYFGGKIKADIALLAADVKKLLVNFKL